MANNTDASNTTKPAKVKKAKGPIRFEAVVPFTIIVVLVIVYFKLFFDSNLKSAIELGGYYANGAEVNVASVHTSFWDLSFELDGLEVTDSKRPTKNLIKIEHIYANLLWDAILRFKFVVEKSGVTGIQTYVDRNRPGKVKPPEVEDKDGGGAFDLAKDKALNVAKQEFKGNAVGDVAKVADGADMGGSLANIEGQLKSKPYIEQLSKELQGKEKEWKAKIDSLPKGPEIDNLKKRIANIKINTSNFAELQKNLKEIDSVAREANDKIGGVQKIANELKTDVDKYSKMIEQVDALVKEDQKMLQNRLKIPSLDAKDLARNLFGPQVMDKLAKAEEYMRLARKYMPPKKTEEQKAALAAKKIEPPPRGKGQNYQFGRPNSYPLFWVKRTDITSKAAKGGMNGDVQGYMTDLTSDPPSVGRPTVLDVKGSFPEQKIDSAELKVIIDHVTSVPKEFLGFKVNGFPVQGQMLSNSDDVKFGFEDAVGDSVLALKLQEENVDMSLNNSITNIKYVAQAKSQHVDDILKGVVKDIPKITLDASATGTWSDLKLDVQSNLATELQKGFEKQIQAKIDEAKKKVDEFIEKNIGSKKRELTAQYDQLKKQYLGAADKKKEEINQVTNAAQNKTDESKKQGQKQGEDKAKQEVQKGLEDLKKNFKF